MSGPPARGYTAIRTALTDRLKHEAATSARELQHVRRQFVLRRFLTRVFADQPDDWILKGGTAMVLRLPNARPSKDLDLLRRGTVTLDTALGDLQRAAARSDVDPFTFAVIRADERDDLEGLRLTIRCDLGPTEFDRFPIDLVTGKGGFIGPVEHYRTVDRFTAPTEFATDAQAAVYPIADQVADKLAAMYERHGANIASTRYHGLVDLILISEHFPIEHNITVVAIDNQRGAREGLTLPHTLIAPDPRWHRNWPATARASQLHSDLHALPDALVWAADCYTPLLAAPATPLPHDKTWTPHSRTWTTNQPPAAAATDRVRAIAKTLPTSTTTRRANLSTEPPRKTPPSPQRQTGHQIEP